VGALDSDALRPRARTRTRQRLPPALTTPDSSPTQKTHKNTQDLFRRITALSYMGDVRMGLAEDSLKVERIVAGSYAAFEALYAPLLLLGGGGGGGGDGDDGGGLGTTPPMPLLLDASSSFGPIPRGRARLGGREPAAGGGGRVRGWGMSAVS
jgi:hypothetical protein